jgi:hypothetical protein
MMMVFSLVGDDTEIATVAQPSSTVTARQLRHMKGIPHWEFPSYDQVSVLQDIESLSKGL